MEFYCEGRLIMLEYSDFFFINCYIPNSQGSSERHYYCCEWERRFAGFVNGLTKRKPVIICEDFNAMIFDVDIYP